MKGEGVSRRKKDLPMRNTEFVEAYKPWANSFAKKVARATTTMGCALHVGILRLGFVLAPSWRLRAADFPV